MKENKNLKSGSVFKGEFLTNEILDCKFKEIAEYHLILIEEANPKTDLKKIRHDKLCVLANCIEQYRPKSKSRKDKRSFIEYLKKIQDPISTYSFEELISLRSQFIEPVVDSRRYGFENKYVWLGGLAFMLPVDLIILSIVNFLIWLFIGQYYLFVPFISIGFIIFQFRRELRAKREGKLW